MTDTDQLAQAFEKRRGRLRAIAYRILGSFSEADDAVQEAWLRLSRTDAGEIRQLDAWLTTVVGRVCLNMLRSRERRREEPLEIHVPDPVVADPRAPDPEDTALLAESVGLALLVVIETLPPAERLAFVLHDTFAIPFDDIAGILGRSPEAARQLASRARRRVQGEAHVPDADLRTQHEVVDAYLAAAREGDFDRLVALLDPEVVLHADGGPGQPALRLQGSTEVARGALSGARGGGTVRPVLVNGAPGAVVVRNGSPAAVLSFTVVDRRIADIVVINDVERLRRLGIS